MGLFGGKVVDDEKDIQISRLTSEKQELEKRIDDLTAINARYQTNARSFESETDTVRQHLLAQVKKTEKAQDEIVRLNETLRGMQGEINRLKRDNVSTDADELRNKIVSLNSEIARLETELEEARAENADLAKSAGSSDSSDALQALKDANAKLVGYLKNAKSMVLDFKEKEKTWEAEKAKAKEVILKLKSNIDELKSKIGTANADKDLELERTKSALETAEKELESVRKEIVLTRAARDDMQQELNHTHAALTTMKAERDTLQEELTALKTKLSSLLG